MQLPLFYTSIFSIQPRHLGRSTSSFRGRPHGASREKRGVSVLLGLFGSQTLVAPLLQTGHQHRTGQVAQAVIGGSTHIKEAIEGGNNTHDLGGQAEGLYHYQQLDNTAAGDTAAAGGQDGGEQDHPQHHLDADGLAADLADEHNDAAIKDHAAVVFQRHGDLDLVITNRPLDPEEYERLLCYREQLVLAVPETFPINDSHRPQKLRPEELGEEIAQVPPERCVSLTEFSDIPYVVLQEGNYLRLCTDVMFQECRLHPQVLLEVQKSAVAYNFAHFGLGATIISNMLVAHRPVGDGLVYYKIRSDHATRDAYLCYRKGRYVTTAMKKIIELLTEPDVEGTLSP